MLRPQGRHGELMAELHTDFPGQFAERKQVSLLAPSGTRRQAEIESSWPHKGGLVLKFRGVDSISAAEELSGHQVQIAAEQRRHLEDGSAYVSDLLGCVLRDVAGAGPEVGVVEEVLFGAGEAPVLVVRKSGKEFLVPFAAEFLVSLDTAGKHLEMRLPAGMLELDAPLSAEEKRAQSGGTRMKFEVLTIFPDFFRGPLDFGIVRRAREAELIDIRVHDLRTYTRDRHRTVDDRPFGGGEGMVLKPEPIFECAESLAVSPREVRMQCRASESVILLSPQGQLFTQALAQDLASLDRVVLICGRYEGVDERVGEHMADREVSIGDYVLSGGELAAAVLMDAVTRLLPGALGNQQSSRQESFSVASAAEAATNGPDSTCGSGGLLDYPHYTRPADFRGMQVPEELVSGNHDQIREWRRRKALEKTLRNRPELLEQVALNQEDQNLLARIKGLKAQS